MRAYSFQRMPFDPPTGFLTRPEAAKRFNRSQRALERDLNIAKLAEDEEVLAHYKLVTKDGKKQDAEDITTEMVKELQSDGFVPVWCVA